MFGFFHRSIRGAAVALALGLSLASRWAAAEEARLLRFPAIHGEQVVFSFAGDLYTVPAQGGVARKLTSHVGYEMFARFSPDGRQLAFTGQSDGNTEVYLMPAEGGVPRRLTYTATLDRDDVSDRMGPNNIVMIALIQHALDPPGPVFSGSVLHGRHMSPAGQRFYFEKDLGHAVANVFMVYPGGSARLTGPGGPDFSD